MPTLVPVEGALLRQVLHTAVPAAALSRDAWARYERALALTPWGREHRRWLASVDSGGRLLASAHCSSLAGRLDDRALRICGIGGVTEHDATGGAHARWLVDRLVAEAAARGDDWVLLAVAGTAEPSVPDGFLVLPTRDLTLRVIESTRRGAPMAPVRGGDAGDMAAVAAIASHTAGRARLRLDRDPAAVAFALTRTRLLAGLAAGGARQVQFLVAEEGMRAVAYVVISVVAGTWTIEECGDRDPTGARVGAILQALIARDPAETRTVIRAWLPPGFLPPQTTMLASAPSHDRLLVRATGAGAVVPALEPGDVLFWRSDLP